MLQKLPQSNGKVLAYAIRGNISEEDLRMVDSEIQTTVQRHGQVRLLVNYEDLSGFDLDALDEDLRLARHLGNIERYAVVSDNRLYDWVTSGYDAVSDIDMRHFKPGDEALAWAWLK